jgi:hypothetical protein
MKTVEDITCDPDTEALIESITTGKPLDPEIRDRLREEGRKISAELREKFGEMEIAAQLIRECRDE